MLYDVPLVGERSGDGQGQLRRLLAERARLAELEGTTWKEIWDEQATLACNQDQDQEPRGDGGASTGIPRSRGRTLKVQSRCPPHLRGFFFLCQPKGHDAISKRPTVTTAFRFADVALVL